MPTLFESKIRIPAVARGVVLRPELHAALERGPGVRVTLVVAPAGFGKTTLLASWLTAGSKRPCAWVSVDEGDHDAERFLAHVLEALRRAVPAMRGGAAGTADGSRAVALTALANELEQVGTEVALVLDDCHLITSAASRQILRFIVERLPACVHVVLSTRAETSFRLGRLRALRELAEIRAPQLRFDADGATRLVHAASDRPLDAKVASHLLELTEGWPAALWLAGLALRDHPDPDGFVRDFAGDHRHIQAYVLEEILEAQTPAERSFLLRTSVLDRLSGALCDAVLARSGSAALLAALEQRNQPLVALDDHDGWYRYNPLFADALRAHLIATEPEVVAELHRRAAAWFQEAGEVDAAVRHAVAAADFGSAARMIVAHGPTALTSDGMRAIGAWLGLLPAEYVEGDPQLAACAAWHARLTGAAEATFRDWMALARRPDGERAWVGVARTRATELALLQMLEPHGDVGAMVRAARAAVEAVPADDPAAALALLHLGVALMHDARHAAARAPLEAVLATLSEREPVSYVSALALLAAADARCGARGPAARRVEQALELIARHRLARAPTMGFALMALADALLAAGEPSRALALADDAAGLLAAPAPDVGHAHALLVLARCHAALGDGTSARTALDHLRGATAGAADARAILQLASDLKRSFAAIPQASISLTRRELEVLQLMDGELTRREIGAALFVSSNTVKTHVRSILGKVGAGSRAEAVQQARRLGFLP